MYVVKVLAAQKVPQHRSLYIVILLVVWRDKKVSCEKIRAQLFSMLASCRCIFYMNKLHYYAQDEPLW